MLFNLFEAIAFPMLSSGLPTLPHVAHLFEVADMGLKKCSPLRGNCISDAVIRVADIILLEIRNWSG